MRGVTVSKAKRMAAGIMGLLLLAVVLLSALFLAAEADHDCAGEDCPICAVMQACANTLRRYGGAAAARPAAAVPVVFFLFAAALPAAVFLRETPVSRGTRLNN